MIKLSGGVRSYSQEGEDLLLWRIFERSPSGFYVDVGAHHPIRFSNTYLFYKRGWRGINIDAAPGSMSPFRRYRVGDINIESGVGSSATVMPFFVFNDPALNSFDRDLSESRQGEQYRIKEILNVTVRPLAELLRGYLPGAGPSFLNVDVEGLDIDVLRSNDWEVFKPDVVLVECAGISLEGVLEHPLTLFLNERGYVLVSKTLNTLFFLRRNSKFGGLSL